MKFKLIALTVTLAMFATFLAACGDMGTNTNTRANNSLANYGTNNATNAAIVVNANANMSSNRWANGNVNRADYDRDRSQYERDRGNSKIGTGANDSWLWFKTRTALLTTSDLRESTIDVDVENDVVTLRGTVETAAQKTRAMQVAKDIDGVKSVRDQLKVAPEDSMTNTSGNSNANRR
ncbi:MAG: BON domain-containing protein [Acidobacteria bacterium]|nr:BON domain-containing protein [Acidobacteriota bacterium]